MNERKQDVRTTQATEDWDDSMIRWSLDRLASMHRFAEMKVAAILGVSGILLVPLADKLPDTVKVATTRCPTLGVCIVIALAVYGFAQVGVAISALLVLWPRLRSSRRSLFYFGDIDAMTYEEFCKAYTQSSPAELRQHGISQIYDNAHIAGIKFVGVKWCIASLGVALVPWAVLMVLA